MWQQKEINQREKNYDEVRVRVAKEKRKAVQGEKYMQKCH